VQRLEAEGPEWCEEFAVRVMRAQSLEELRS
jgi:hypothetical protein